MGWYPVEAWIFCSYCICNFLSWLLTAAISESSKRSLYHDILFLSSYLECYSYTEINDLTRSVAYSSTNETCDSDVLSEGTWYRFSGSAGSSIPDYPPNLGFCGASYPSLLGGGHPTVEDGRATRYLWLRISSNSYTGLYIEVRNCSTFFVYKLLEIRDWYCDWRVCTDQGKRCNLE